MFLFILCGTFKKINSSPIIDFEEIVLEELGFDFV